MRAEALRGDDAKGSRARATAAVTGRSTTAAGLLAMVGLAMSFPAFAGRADRSPALTRVAAACTRTHRENCEELDRYCVFNTCLLFRNDNNKYRTCARSCSDSFVDCTAACDAH